MTDPMKINSNQTRWMMKRSIHTLLIQALGITLCIGMGSGTSFAEEKTSETLGQALSHGSLLGASDPSQQGALRIGNADIDIANEIVAFEVGNKGEQQAAQLEEGTLVQGLLICNISAGVNATVVSTPPVSIQADGTAQYSGNLSFPSECKDQSQLGFMIQILNPGTEV